MYADAFLSLSSAQTVTGASSVLSTNTIDQTVARDIGEGGFMPLGRFQVTTAFTGLTALEMQIVTADDAGLSTNLTVIGTTGAIPVAQLTAGARFACEINPRIGSKGQRYIGARYILTGTGTAGALTADIGLEIQDGQKFYPTGIAVI